MAIYNLGSINRDLIYDVDHLPNAGETLAANSLLRTLGGKGLNQSVAAVRAGARVVHIGSVGADDHTILEELSELGLDTTHVSTVHCPTGHAIINVDRSGENAIVLFQGANISQSEAVISSALCEIAADDILLIQNETNQQVFAAKTAKSRSAKVIYSAAPFDANAVKDILEHVSVLVMNELEGSQLQTELSVPLTDLPVESVIITKGAKGADWLDVATGKISHCPSHPANVVDTTGAGDTFIGYVAAGLADGKTPQDAMRFGSLAAALMVSRQGTATVIPTKLEVDALG